jgi:XTP/dITP diphosphohydrolase
MKILLGTKNKGKVIEAREVFNGSPITLLSPEDISITVEPEETGSTFEENAEQKARFYRELSGLPTAADDSGIIVEALEKELGIHTRRWGAGPKSTDQEWIEYFLKRMKSEPHKRARFVCVVTYIDEKESLHTFRGECEGVITETLEADYLPGLPISACFKPEGFDRVFSALTIEQKNSTSHRGKAFADFRAFVTKEASSAFEDPSLSSPRSDRRAWY